MADIQRLDFVTLRGGTPDERSPVEKPYSAVSYSAQYGIPLDDAQALLDSSNVSTHGDMRRIIYKEYLGDEDFRESALYHVTRPYGERSDAEKLGYDIATTSKEQASGIKKRFKPGQDVAGDMNA